MRNKKKVSRKYKHNKRIAKIIYIYIYIYIIKLEENSNLVKLLL